MNDTTVRRYLTAAGALLGLLALTIALAYVDLGAGNLPVALTIASVKAILVGWFFMHLRDAGASMRLFAFAGLLWLAFLVTFTLTDVFTR